MIIIKEFPDKTFENKEDAIKELILNRKTILSVKKAAIKHADALPYFGTIANTKGEAIKAGSVIPSDVNNIVVTAVSNACNYYDSHGDVSLPGSWTRTANNTKDGLHLQEHRMEYSKIISDDVSFSVEKKRWKDLGFPYEGETEVLMMTSKVDRADNPYMFDRYARGKVKNHSAGLRYVNIDLAANSDAEYAKDAKALWDKYYPQIANKEDVDEAGYFFAVFEQKIIENSAVPKGSNPATPTISVEPAAGTSTNDDDPAKATHQGEQTKVINLNLF